MKHFIIGDVHGAGIEVMESLQKISPSSEDQIVFVGDVLDRGIHGHVVWDIIKKHNAIVLMGNHEYKMMKFLQGKRQGLPPHYYWCLNNLLEHNVGMDDLLKWLQNLPLLKVFENGKKFIVTHAGVDVNQPTAEDLSWNVYGTAGVKDPSYPMPYPKPEDKGLYWWDHYKQSVPVYYGHLVCYGNVPRICYDDLGNINSVGVDTALVHGGPATIWCVEEEKCYQYQSGKDWYSLLKAEMKSTPPVLHSSILDFIQKQKDAS